MGANTSKAAHATTHHTHYKVKDLVDLGPVLPNGLYATALQDYDLRIVRNLIVARRLAPFYKGLEDVPEPGTDTGPPSPHPSSSTTSASPTSKDKQTPTTRPRSASNSQHNRDKSAQARQLSDRELATERLRHRKRTLYNDPVECPVCFLYYPANINHSRCCDQPICTECFVQIKRPAESPTTPAACPFCMQENFGVVYQPPSWSDGAKVVAPVPDTRTTTRGVRHTTSGVSQDTRPRRKTIRHDDPSVVLTDHIRPDWKRELAAQALAHSPRRSSASSSSTRGPTILRTVPTVPGIYYVTRRDRSASSATPGEHTHYVREADMDLEEWMVMEAIRQSLAEQERQAQEQQRQQTQSQSTQIPTHDNTSLDTTTATQGADDDDDQPLYVAAQMHGFQQQTPTLESSHSSAISSSPLSHTSDPDSAIPLTPTTPTSPTTSQSVLASTEDNRSPVQTGNQKTTNNTTSSRVSC